MFLSGDHLFDMVMELDHLLRVETFDQYGPGIRRRIVTIRNQMDTLRAQLDLRPPIVVPESADGFSLSRHQTMLAFLVDHIGALTNAKLEMRSATDEVNVVPIGESGVGTDVYTDFLSKIIHEGGLAVVRRYSGPIDGSNHRPGMCDRTPIRVYGWNFPGLARMKPVGPVELRALIGQRQVELDLTSGWGAVEFAAAPAPYVEP